jgi:elongation factor Ts
MADISASMVMELRQRTGLGMMECKKALTETAGDLAKAEELLRIKSGAKATKAASRIAAEGIVGAWLAADGRTAAMVEVNCETDFVSRNEDFLAFAKKLAHAIRRFARFATPARLMQYLHGGGRIGVTVELEGGDEATGRDIAMHVAASAAPGAIRPVCISRDQVPAELIAKEREIYAAQAADSGKPADIVAKMVEGRINKYLAEVTLLGQPFVKNPDESVEKHLKAKGAAVKAFTLYVVGEGIEKRKDDFAAEVAAMAKA